MTTTPLFRACWSFYEAGRLTEHCENFARVPDWSPYERHSWTDFCLSAHGRRIANWRESLTSVQEIQTFWVAILRTSGKKAADTAVLEEWRQALHAEQYTDWKRKLKRRLEPLRESYADIPLGKPITTPDEAYDYMTRYFCCCPLDTNVVLSDKHPGLNESIPKSYSQDEHLTFHHKSPHPPMGWYGGHPQNLENHIGEGRILFHIIDCLAHHMTVYAWGLAHRPATDGPVFEVRQIGRGFFAILDKLIVRVARDYQIHVAKEVRLAAAASPDVLTTRILRAEWGPTDLPGLAHLAALRIVMEAGRSPSSPGEPVDVSEAHLGKLVDLRPAHARRLVLPHLRRVTLAGEPLFVGDWPSGRIALNPALAGLLGRRNYREMAVIDWTRLRGLSKHALALALPVLGIGQVVRQVCTWTASADELRRVLHLPKGAPMKKVTVALKAALGEIRKALPVELDVSTEPDRAERRYVVHVKRREMDRVDGLNGKRAVPARRGLPWEWHKPSPEALKCRSESAALTRRVGYTAAERRDMCDEERAALETKPRLGQLTVAIIDPIPGTAGVRIFLQGKRIGIDVRLHADDLIYLKERRRPYYFPDDLKKKWNYNYGEWLGHCLWSIVACDAGHHTPEDERIPVNRLLSAFQGHEEPALRPSRRLHSTYLDWESLLDWTVAFRVRGSAREFAPVPAQPVQARSPRLAKLAPFPPPAPFLPVPTPVVPADRVYVDMFLDGVSVGLVSEAGRMMLHVDALAARIGDVDDERLSERLRKTPLDLVAHALAVVAVKVDDPLVPGLLSILANERRMAVACRDGHVRLSRGLAPPVYFDDAGDMQIPSCIGDDPADAAAPTTVPRVKMAAPSIEIGPSVLVSESVRREPAIIV